MNRRLHMALCLGAVVAGFAASVALALQGAPASIALLCAGAYALSGVGHWVLLQQDEGRANGWGDMIVSALWPLLDCWLVAWTFLPMPGEGSTR